MNEAIVWALDKTFPAPVSMEEKLEELANVVSMLKDSKNTYQGVDDLIGTIQDTLFDVVFSKIPTAPDFRKMVEDRHNYWQEQLADEYNEKHHNPFEEPPSDEDLPF